MNKRNVMISVIPSAREPNMTALCEMDLSPGTVISPLSIVFLETVISDVALFVFIDRIIPSGKQKCHACCL